MKFLADITLGQFLPGDSFLHRLDPRTKFIALLLLMSDVFLISSFPGLLFLVGFFFLGLFLSRLSWSFVFRGIRPFIWLFLIAAGIHLFSTPGPSLPFFPISFINPTWTGANKGALVAGQLFLTILFSSLMTLTTSPLQMVHGLEKIFYPLKKLRVPVEDLSMMMMLAIKFIPILQQEADRIIKAQSARGVDFESGGLRQRAKNMLPILTPLFNSVIKRADDLAVALMARGYVSGKKRTHLHELEMKARDWGTLLVVASFSFLVIKI
ncbi:MAG: energy-coupling factor transporter transmembrane component T family protein [Thermodesulfobacteriota bacterium]